MATTPLDDLQIKISVQSSDASKSIKNLTKALEQLAGVKTVNLDGIIKQMQDLQAQTSRVANSVADAWQNLSGKVRDASTEVGDSADESADHIEEVEKSSWSLSASLADSLKNLKSLFQGTANSLGRLSGAIKRIAFYRMIRAAIKAVTKALKEGVEMLVTWDREFGRNTSYAVKTTDELAAKWREVKKSLGAAAMPIIQIFQPALMSLMQLVINVANTINQLFRTFQGFTTYIKATDKGFKSATGSAKALKAVLFGFDELNVLPDASGGGASSDIGAIDFKEVDIEYFNERVQNALEGIRQLAQDVKDTLSGVWEVIRGKAKIILGLLGGDFGLFWEGLKENVSGWAKTIAGVFKTLVGWAHRFFEPLYMWFYNNVWKPIGDFFRSLPEMARNALDAVKNFFVNIWTAIATWFKDSFVPFFKAYFDTLWGGIKTGIDAVVGFFKTVWGTVSGWVNENVITPVSNFFTGLWTKIKEGAKGAWDGIKSVFGVVTTWFKTKFTEAWTAVKNVFSTGGKIFVGIKDGIISGFKTVVNAIIRGINKVIAVPFNGINTALTKIRDISILGFEPFKNLIKTIGVPQIPLLAKGGFIPNTGSLFMAGENGAELVTHAPNGTEVMNGNQVEQAMTNANVEVINAIYAMANMVVGAVNNKNFDIYMDTQKVGKSVTQYQLNYARAMGV